MQVGCNASRGLELEIRRPSGTGQGLQPSHARKCFQMFTSTGAAYPCSNDSHARITLYVCPDPRQQTHESATKQIIGNLERFEVLISFYSGRRGAGLRTDTLDPATRVVSARLAVPPGLCWSQMRRYKTTASAAPYQLPFHHPLDSCQVHWLVNSNSNDALVNCYS
jgi:hypothetical protein